MKKKLVKAIVLGLALGCTTPGYAAINEGTHDISGDITGVGYVSATGSVVLNATGDTNFQLTSGNVFNLSNNDSSIVVNGNNHDLKFGAGGQLIYNPAEVTSNEKAKVEILNAHDITVESSEPQNSVHVSGSVLINLEANNDINFTQTAPGYPTITSQADVNTVMNFKAGHDINLEAESNSIYIANKGNSVYLEAGNDINFKGYRNAPPIVIERGAKGKFVAGRDFISNSESNPVSSRIGGKLSVEAERNIDITSGATIAGLVSRDAGSELTLTAKNGHVHMLSTGGNSSALLSYDNALTNISAKKEVELGGNAKIGLNIKNGAVADITSETDKIKITATDTTGELNAAVYTKDAGGKVNLHSDTVLTAVTYGINGLGGTTTADKALTITGTKTAINLASGGIVNALDVASDKKIEGNILSEGEGSAANINLETAGSYLTGGTTVSNDGKINLNFANNAKWNVTGNSSLTNLGVASGAVVNMNHTGRDVYETLTTEDFSGMGGDFIMDTDLASETDGDKLVINNGTKAASGTIQVYDKSLSTGKEVTGEKYLLLVKDDKGNTTWTGKALEDGGIWDIVPRIGRGDTLGKGDTNWYLYKVDRKPSASAEGIKGAVDSSYGLWRNSLTDDTLRKRLGDLRYKETESGVWARIKSGKLAASSYDATYQTYQVGYDKKSGEDTYYGFAVDHTNNKTSYERGRGEGSMTGLSLYATNYHKGGAYSDLVLRGNKVRSDMDSYGEMQDHGNFASWAYSLSYELGKTYEKEHGWFVEPEAQLTYGRLQGANHITKAGVKVDKEATSSLLGRVGFVLGRKLENKSDYYLKANMYREFKGDAAMNLSAVNSYGDREYMSNRESNKDTWFELGLGGNVKLAKKTQLYGDVAKTFGADIQKKWQINAGVRWEF